MSAAVDTGEERVPVYVWDLVVRLSHWVIVLGIVLLSVTGFYIGHPIGTSSVPAAPSFIMGWIKVIHFYGAIAFSLAVCARVAWMFLGPKYARWTQFLPVSAQRRRDLIGTFKFYTFMRSEPPPAIGHNALAGFSYIAVFGLYFVMIGTGVALYGMDAHVSSYMHKFAWLLPYMGGPQSARWIHHVVMWLLLGFAVHHVYSATLMAKVEKNGTMDSIFGGWKTIKKDHLDV